jgi:hypothetical protein
MTGAVCLFAERLMQRRRRAFPEHLSILNRKTPEFDKAKTGRDFGDGHGPITSRH